MKTFAFSSLLLLSACSFLWAAKEPSAVNQSNAWYLNTSTGASWPTVTSNNYLATGNGWPQDHYSIKEAGTTAFLSLGGGYRWATQQRWLPFYSFGASYTYYFPSLVQGHIFQYDLPQFENYNYRYQMRRQTLLASFKAHLYQYHHWLPFVAFGLGSAFTHLADYNETPVSLNITPRISPGFQNHTSQSISYLISAGLESQLTKNFWLGVGYHYGYFGDVKTGRGVFSYATDELKTTLYDNALVIQMNYYFENGI